MFCKSEMIKKIQDQGKTTTLKHLNVILLFIYWLQFLVEDSIEERMMDLQERKRELMQGAFGKKQTAEQRRAQRITDIKTLINF